MEYLVIHDVAKAGFIVGSVLLTLLIWVLIERYDKKH